ncbi:MAG: aldehyde ferredoxin oxidoreductase, partial [Chloroflexi bacterium]|nr:aldehyde ferredoxin oxidoreductase [Chloroflexota bacterium]
NLVRFACIMNDLKEAHGRGGTGAVMGSKNLKAIAAHGRKRPEVADPDKVRDLARWMGQNFKDQPLFGKSLSLVGTGEHGTMLGGNDIGNLPSHNFDWNSFDETANITANTTMDTYGVGMDGCTACGVRCKKVVEIGAPWNVDRRNGGPEYESLAALGSTCGVGDLAAVCKANELANLYSLDTISLGVTIAFGMECFEKELLSSEDTNGLQLKFGNGDALVQAVEMIARREGNAGDILAEGTKKAAERIGKGSDEFAVHVKGVEIPMHDPRVKQGLGVVYSVEAHGADHCAGMHDTGHTQESPGVDHLRGLGGKGPMPADELSMNKVVTEKAAHVNALFRDSLVCCSMLPWTVSQHAEIVRALTGWSYTVHEAVQLGERIATLGRVFNLREGLTKADDTLPKRMFTGTQRGALKNGGIDRAKMQGAVKMFYGVMGWDEETGIPTRAKLGELGVSWAAEYIPA